MALADALPALPALSAVVETLPPAWVFVVLALPHLWYMCVTSHAAPALRTRLPRRGRTQHAADCRPARARWVLLHPSSTKRTAALFRMDAVEWFADVALALNVAQFAALFAFIATSSRFSLAGLAARWAESPGRALSVPMFALGTVFKVTIFTAIGKKGVYYGAKFGHTIPWVHGFPFSVTGARGGKTAHVATHCTRRPA